MLRLKNERLIKALRHQPVDRTPVWLMRQAGRYLPEYRKLREKFGDFMTLCKAPELACEITLQPLHRFDLDAAIIFSDILTIPDAMGLGLYFKEGEGPCFKSPVRTLKAIERLVVPNMEKLSYVIHAIRLVNKELAGKVPLIGFSGSPWTLATYMVEGGSSKTFNVIKRLLYSEPNALHQLLSLLTKAVIDYLSEQIKAGVHVVQLFDTWGGVLAKTEYLQFSLQYMRMVIKTLKQLHPEVPIILFSKNGGKYLEEQSEAGCDGLSLDWTCDLSVARKCVGNKVALQGNLDPAILYASPKRLQQAIQEILMVYKGEPGYIFNLGHGIAPDVSPEQVALLVDTVHKFND